MATRKKAPTKPVVAPSSEEDAAVSSIVTRNRSLVFISHDSRDSDIAEAFANLLSDVSAGMLKSFRSSDKKSGTGIEFGAEWYTSIMSQLGGATDVVALLTARSIDRPWILYEAGVAKGKLETTVLGLALGVPLEQVSTGPFGQFQNCGDDEDSLTKLVIQLLQRNPDAAPREEAVRFQVKLFIEKLKGILEAKPKKAGLVAVHDEQNVAKLFEEVKAMVRELPERVDHRVGSATRKYSDRRWRNFHPEMFEEVLLRAEKLTQGRNASGLLLLLSIVKDDVAWIYEAGIDVYRAIVSGNRSSAIAAHKRFRAVNDLAEETPIFFDGGKFDSEEIRMLAHFSAKFFDNYSLSLIKRMSAGSLVSRNRETDG